MKEYFLNLYKTIYVNPNHKFVFSLMLFSWIILFAKWIVFGLNDGVGIVLFNILGVLSFIFCLYLGARAYALDVDENISNS